jgi:hypothetical protein
MLCCLVLIWVILNGLMTHCFFWVWVVLVCFFLFCVDSWVFLIGLILRIKILDMNRVVNIPISICTCECIWCIGDMNMENGNIMTVFIIILTVGAVIFAGVISVWAISGAMTQKIIIVKGNVIDVVALDNYMVVYMENGSSYNIRYPGDNIDLTKGSTVVMRLIDYNYFWLDDGIWESVSITKVPDIK